MNLKSLVLFSDEMLVVDSRIIKRGRNESTRYFLIPKKFKISGDKTTKLKCNLINGDGDDKYLVIKLKATKKRGLLKGFD